MEEFACIEAQVAWMILFSGSDRVLRDSAAPDYSGMLEGMEAAELLALIEQAQLRLDSLKQASAFGREADMGLHTTLSLSHLQADEAPVKLFFDKQYNIFLDGPDGERLPFRPLVRAIFILFLKHPEGILLKERDQFQSELEEIYGIIAQNVSPEDRRRRIRRLMDLQGNAFSENTSVLNATLDRVLPPHQADVCKIQGYNGHPRKISLSPLLVEWEV